MEKIVTAVRRYEPIPDSEEMGDAMRAILPQQRAFVAAYVENASRNATAAARMAGYGATSDTKENYDNTCRHAGARLLRNENVQRAIRELAQAHLNATSYHAAAVLVEIMEDPTHKDRLKAAEMVMNRAGMLVVHEQKVVHEHRVEKRDAIMERIKSIADRNGVDLNKLIPATHLEALPAPVVDATFEPAPSSDGLEDLL